MAPIEKEKEKSSELLQAFQRQRFIGNEFLKHLQSRGIHGIRLGISDDHPGLKSARMAVFPSLPWQRCQFHLAQNAQAYAPKQSMKLEIAEVVREIFNSPNIEMAREMVRRGVEKYVKR